MIPVVKQNIIEQNSELIVEKIKELSHNYEVEEEKVKEYFQTIISKIILNDNINISEDLSDVYDILENVTSDQSLIAVPMEEEDRTLVTDYRSFEESSEYYINDYYRISENPENIQIVTLPRDDFNVLISGLLEETKKYIVETFGSYYYDNRKDTINSYANYIYDKCVANNVDVNFSDFTNVEKVQYVFRRTIEYYLSCEIEEYSFENNGSIMSMQEYIDKLLKKEFNIETSERK